MAKVEIYTRPLCGFCTAAKKLLDSKNISYQEYNIWKTASAKDDMARRAPNAHTVPQIFIDDKNIGGCDDLYALEQQNKLDELLK